MWWLYFDAIAESGSRAIANANNAARQARRTYTYIHILLVAGVILSAVADEFVLAHAGAPAGGAAIAILGGAALFCLGIALFKWSITHVMPTSPWLAIGALAAMMPFAARLPQLSLLLAANGVLIALAGWDAHARRHCPPAG
jgi:low temperature requirement protein LtrA